jgi:hypothetical protein
MQLGKSILSQYRNTFRGSFGRSIRQGIADKEKGKLPGPKYSMFSEFGTRRL